MPSTKAQPLKLNRVKTPSELALEHIRSAKELADQHMQLTGQSIDHALTNLSEIVGNKELYSDGVRQRAEQLREHMDRELQALQGTQGWPKPPAAPTTARTAASQP